MHKTLTLSYYEMEEAKAQMVQTAGEARMLNHVPSQPRALPIVLLGPY